MQTLLGVPMVHAVHIHYRYLPNKNSLCCCRTSVSSFKQYFSPPINAFDKLCICHAAKCNFSSNRNHVSVFSPQNVQLGIQVIFLQGVTRHMQHGQGLQARLLARLACMQAAVKQGNPHIWPSTHDPVKQQVTGMTPGIMSGLLRLRLSTSAGVSPDEAYSVSLKMPSMGKPRAKHCLAR